MGKTKLTKGDIGLPTQFRHVCHIGWDPKKGFDCVNIEDDLKPFFERAGVSDRQLNNKATRQFIYKFIEQNGGWGAMTVEADRNASVEADRDASVEVDRDASTAPTGVNSDEIDTELKPLFDRAGISDRHLKNRKTRKLIYKVIEENGGLEVALAEAKQASSLNPTAVDEPPVQLRQPRGRSRKGPAPQPPSAP